MQQNKTIYFPAISFSSHLKLLDREKHFNGKSFRFYQKENSVFHYPFLLVSAGHNYKYETIVKDIGFDFNRGVLLGDSGGFQLATEKLKYNEDIVKKLFDWLENNSNYALTLDFPPYIGSFSTTLSLDVFRERLGISLKNFDYFKKHDSGKTKFLNVLHGRCKTTLNEWYEAVKHYEFPGGWAIGGASVNLFYLLQSFFYLYEKGEYEKYANKSSLIHLLGISKSKVIPYISHLQKKLNDKGIDVTISYDSSYPIQTAGWGHYFLFMKKTGMTNLDISNSIIKDKEPMNQDVPMPCGCPICKGVKFSDILGMENQKGTGYKQEAYNYIAMHNMYMLIQYKKIVESLIFTGCKSMIDSIFNQQDQIVLNIINKAFDSKEPCKCIHEHRNILSKIDMHNDESTVKIDRFFV